MCIRDRALGCVGPVPPQAAAAVAAPAAGQVHGPPERLRGTAKGGRPLVGHGGLPAEGRRRRAANWPHAAPRKGVEQDTATLVRAVGGGVGRFVLLGHELADVVRQVGVRPQRPFGVRGGQGDALGH
eukprot:9499899-Pyramimonas_sp.AAC.1